MYLLAYSGSAVSRPSPYKLAWFCVVFRSAEVTPSDVDNGSSGVSISIPPSSSMSLAFSSKDFCGNAETSAGDTVGTSSETVVILSDAMETSVSSDAMGAPVTSRRRPKTADAEVSNVRTSTVGTQTSFMHEVDHR